MDGPRRDETGPSPTHDGPLDWEGAPGAVARGRPYARRTGTCGVRGAWAWDACAVDERARVMGVCVWGATRSVVVPGRKAIDQDVACVRECAGGAGERGEGQN